jgi:hypothetical protein
VHGFLYIKFPGTIIPVGGIYNPLPAKGMPTLLPFSFISTAQTCHYKIFFTGFNSF